MQLCTYTDTCILVLTSWIPASKNFCIKSNFFLLLPKQVIDFVVRFYRKECQQFLTFKGTIFPTLFSTVAGKKRCKTSKSTFHPKKSKYHKPNVYSSIQRRLPFFLCLYKLNDQFIALNVRNLIHFSFFFFRPLCVQVAEKGTNTSWI